MNVNAKLPLTQYPPVTPNGYSTVIKHRQVPPEVPKALRVKDEPESADSAKSAAADESNETGITDAEKQYFENLFPGAAGDIRSYAPYSRNGMKQSGAVGSLVDVKG
jgi:hypothetical protein